MSVPFQFEAPTPEALAALLPAYDFEMLIAKGGMGAVYKARQKSLDRDVAIKILPRELVADPAFRKSFQAEARAMARLNHPNLIAVFDSGEVDGMPYQVMEFVPGKSLYRSAYGHKIEPQQAVELTLGICKGLAHAHDNGILHRDVKPANILLNKKAEPKLGDFGVAHMETEGPGIVVGTPGYTAPEVTRQPDKYDRRADLYSVGVILYELLTGKRPEADSPPPSAVVGVDAALDQIWRRATNSNPGLRYPDCHAFAADLSDWLNKRPGSKGAAAGSPPTTSSLPRRGSPPMRMPAQRQEGPVEVRRSGGMFVNLLLIAILGGGGYFLWKKMSEPAANQDTEIVIQDDGTDSIDSITRQASGNGGKPKGSGITSPFGTTTPRGSGGTTSPFGSTSPNGIDRTEGSGGYFDPANTQGNRGGNNRPAPTSKADGSSDALTVKARELISTAEKDRTKALAENARKMTWDIDGWLRGASKSDQAAWQPQVDALKGTIRDSRVPGSVPENGKIKLSPQMAKALSYAADKQKEIDAAYLAKVGRYRELYVSKMKDAITESEKNSQASAAANQRLLLQDAEGLDNWVRILGGNPSPENPVIDTPTQRPGKSSFFGTPIE